MEKADETGSKIALVLSVSTSEVIKWSSQVDSERFYVVHSDAIVMADSKWVNLIENLLRTCTQGFRL